MSAYVCPRWRNFIATAPSIDLSGFMNSAIEIDLKEHLLQGANPVDNDVINEKKFQGAFWLNYRAVTYPRFGKLQPGTNGTGWKYYPKKDYVGFDSFTYALNNGTQDSNFAVVNIEVKPGLSGSITVYKAQNASYWQLLGSHTIPLEFGTNGTYQFILYTWIKKVPFKVMHLGEPNIHQRYDVMNVSAISYDDNNTPYTKTLAQTTDWENSVWPDTELSGYLPNTVTPYIQPNGPFPYTLKIDFFDKPVYRDVYIFGEYAGITFSHWQEHKTIEIEITQDKGEDWYKNGLVQIVEYDDPSYPNIPT